MMQFFDSHHTDVSVMADDVVFINMATGQETSTPQGVLAMLNYFYRIAFDADADTKNMMFEDGKALVEGYFIGKHIGEFAGIPATGKEVRVPLLVIYDLENDKIKQARIYLEMPVMMAQLGMAAGQAEAG